MKPRLPRPVTQQAMALALTGLSSIAWFPGVGASYARFAVTLLAGASWFMVWAGGGLEKPERNRRLLLAFLFMAGVVVIVSSLRSRFPLTSLTYGGATSVSAAYWIALLAIIGFASRVTLSRSTLSAIAWQFAWVVPVAAIGLVQALTTGVVSIGYRNVDYFAPMMLLFLPVALAFSLRDESRRIMWRGVAALLLAAVIAAGTVSGFVGLAAMSLFTVVFAPGLLGVDGMLRRVLIGVLVMGLLLFALSSALYLADALPDGADEVLDSTVFGASAATRVEMWRVAAIEIRQHLLTGVGPDHYAFEGQRYFSRKLFTVEHDPHPDVALPVDPHSTIILLPLEFGLSGLVMLVLVATTWAKGVLAPPFRSREGFHLRWSFALGALGFGYATLFTPFPLLLGGAPLMFAGLALVRLPEPRPWSPVDRYTVPRLLTAGVAGALAVWIGASAVVGWYVSEQRPTVSDPRSGPVLASEMQPRVAYFRYARLWQEGRLLGRATHAEQVEYQRRVDESPLEVRGYSPYLVELVRLSTDAALNTGRTDLSWEFARLKDAEALSPDLPEIGIERAHALIAAGDVTGAMRELDATEQWRRSVPRWEKYRRSLEGPRP